MNEDRYAKYGAATGLIAVILLLIGFAVVTPSPPDVSAPAAEYTKYFTDHQDGVRAGVLIVSVGLFFFVWFLGSLSDTLRVSAGGPRLPTVAFAGGVVATVALALTLALVAAAAFRPAETSPELTRALNDAALMIAAPAAGGAVALFAATGLVILRSNALPEWLGWLCAVTAVGQALALGVIFTQDGAFAADGVLGLIVPVVTFAVTIAALSITIMRLPPQERSIADRVRGTVTGAAAGAQAGAAGRQVR